MGTSRYIVYSHGFGVRKDDRGLFTDISEGIPGAHHVLFDYNKYDETSGRLTVTPLDAQADILQRTLASIRENTPNATIDLVCHSQGCVVAAMAQPSSVRRMIFLAPPASFAGVDRKIEQMKRRPGTVVDDANQVIYPRRDGTTTIIGNDYWQSREGIDPMALYSQLARLTDLTVVTAANDEVLTDKDYSGLNKTISLQSLPANHDFTGEIRPRLVGLVQQLLTED